VRRPGRKKSVFHGRFLECRDCRFLLRDRPSPICVRCGAGEFFEERIDDRQPTESELMKILKGMGDAES